MAPASHVFLSRYGFVELGSLMGTWSLNLNVALGARSIPSREHLPYELRVSVFYSSFFVGFQLLQDVVANQYIRYPLNPTTNQPVLAYISIVPALPKQLYMCSPLKLGPFTHTHPNQPTTAILLRSPRKWLQGVVSFESSFPTTNPKSQKLSLEFNS